ncbi:hypothetical protein F511_21078 [Dorcoceras hygrometricum]|uniref:Uncharacterized protein n=1 Tax=Dorcoceras hygrometricum TaxID=472368 RepID=A0A2Z7AKC7_9LAMI|nr:hypothetical protein F511_21078 [Dorcoceras hygrometricum]
MYQTPTIKYNDKAQGIPWLTAVVDPPKSSPRSETQVLRQSVLEELTKFPRTEYPRKGDRNKSDHGGDGTAVEAAAERDTASRGPTTIVTPKSQFRTCPSDHGTTGNQSGPSGSSAGRSPRP